VLTLATAAAGCGSGASSDDDGAEEPPGPVPVYWVAASGDDSAPGTKQQPLRTIGAAVDALEGGGTIVVRAGRYPENVTIGEGGMSDRPLVLRGEPGADPELTGRLKISGDNVRVSNLIVAGQTAVNPKDVAVYVSGADGVTLMGLEVRRAGQSGVFVGDGSSRTVIDACWIHDNGRNDFLDHGIYVERATRTRIADNLISHNVGYGIQLYPDADDSVVVHNTIVRNGRSGLIVGGEDTRTDRVVVANNIVAFNGEEGIRTYWGGPVGRENLAEANLVFGNPQGGIRGRGLVRSTTLVAHPAFVDAASEDYHLAPGSVAIDAADPDYATEIDLDGRARPEGDAADLGAFEYASG
jgi:parallel beta-helix repeat protein